MIRGSPKSSSTCTEENPVPEEYLENLKEKSVDSSVSSRRPDIETACKV